MESLEIDANRVAHGTGEASYVTDMQGRILGWNRAAERLLGRPVDTVLGRFCHDVVRGTDFCGRRRCRRCCVLTEATHGNEVTRGVLLDVANVSGRLLRVQIFGLSVPRRGSEGPVIVHFLQPVARVAGPRAAAANDYRHVILTQREREVLGEVARGARNRQVARRLSISEATVRNHMRSILRKLEAHSRLEAVTKVFGGEIP